MTTIEEGDELARAQREFEAALAAMPFGADRIAKGQQFNAYESAANDEDDDPDDWDFHLSLGPITDCAYVLGIEGEWRAKLIEAALRVAMRSRSQHNGATQTEKVLRDLLSDIRRECYVGQPGANPIKSKWCRIPSRLVHRIDAVLTPSSPSSASPTPRGEVE